MANGNAYQRSFPATLATLRRGQGLSIGGHFSKLPPSPLPVHVPARSSSMEPNLTTGHQPNQPLAPSSGIGSDNSAPVCNVLRNNPIKGNVL